MEKQDRFSQNTRADRKEPDRPRSCNAPGTEIEGHVAAGDCTASDHAEGRCMTDDCMENDCVAGGGTASTPRTPAVRRTSGGCRLCPRECGADRMAGKRGRCGVSWKLRVARAALHMWEEPCISGREGSGAVFFSGCPLGCVYCQNREISHGERGEEISVERLGEIFLELQRQKANNINLVTAGHYLPQVCDALKLARSQGLVIPVVYNSSAYEKVESLRCLEGLVDVYLPDFKYISADLSEKYSRAPDYPQTAMAAIREMVRQRPRPQFDGRGIMTSGVIVRHLLLPGHVREAKKVVQYLHETYGEQIYISMMNQYTPMAAVAGDALLGRRVTKREYARLLAFAEEIGVEQGFYQEGGTAAESFIPEFGGQGVLSDS